MPKMSGTRFLAETLKGYGVTHFFFMPVIIPDAMPELEKQGIVRIMAHGEKPAAYMADGYARISGRVGVCGAQSVGAVNLAAGLQDAYLACSPVIAFTGRVPQIQQNRHAYQEVNHADPFSAVTKYNTLVNSVGELPFALRQAFREATTGTPGPVQLDISGIAGEMITEDADLDVVIEEPFSQVPAIRPEPDDFSVRKAISLITNANRPVFIAGGGVTTSNARDELIELAEKLSVPVATSLNAKASFPFDHPLAVGVPGSYSRACANQVVAEADLVFFIGSHTGSQITNGWRIPRPGTSIIQLDINASELGRSFPIELGMQSDVKAGLGKMLGKIKLCDIAEDLHVTWIARTQQLVARWRDEVAPISTSDGLPIRPERLCKELTEMLPDDAVLVSDTGHSGVWTGTMVDLKHPGQSYIRCAGSLGWALPAAIGAKCAVPDRPVICFTGDGGAWYHITEFETAARNGVNAVWIINNNASLNQERNLNELVYGGRKPGSDYLWRFREGKFSEMAKLMDCVGIEVRKPNEIRSAIEEALESDKPAIIDVKTDIEGIAPNAWDG